MAGAPLRWLRRIVAAAPVIAAPLCLLGILPWLTSAQADTSHAVGYSMGIIALVAYPILLAAFLLVAIYLWKRDAEVRAVGRPIYLGLFAAFLVAMTAAWLLMRI